MFIKVRLLCSASLIILFSMLSMNIHPSHAQDDCYGSPQEELLDTPTPLPPLLPIPGNLWSSYHVKPDSVIVYQSSQGVIKTLHLDGSNVVQVSNQQGYSNPRLSPDSKSVVLRTKCGEEVPSDDPNGGSVYVEYSVLWVAKATGSTTYQITQLMQDKAVHSSPVWSADSKKLLFSENDSIIEWDTTASTRREVAKGSVPRYYKNALSYVDSQGNIVLQQQASPKVIVPANALPENGTVTDFQWFKDGQHLAYSLRVNVGYEVDPEDGIQFNTWLFDSSTGQSVKLADNMYDLSISPDNTVVSGNRGSGFADAGHISRWPIFVMLDKKYKPVQTVTISDLTQPQELKVEGENIETLSPGLQAVWLQDSNHVAYVICDTYYTHLGKGIYLIDLDKKAMIHVARPSLD